MNIIYRYSSKGKQPHLGGKPVSKVQCFENFKRAFPYSKIFLICDNCSNPFDEKDFIKIHNVNLGNTGSFFYALDLALSICKNNEIVYFVEDDYLHVENCEKFIVEGLEMVNYVSLYDHLDKYIDGGNPYCNSLGEFSKIFLTKNSHWKTTNSTTCTFATTSDVLKEDIDVIKFVCRDRDVPRDFETFLRLNDKGRVLATPIPGKSTHLCSVGFVSPLIKWEDYL